MAIVTGTLFTVERPQGLSRSQEAGCSTRKQVVQSSRLLDEKADDCTRVEFQKA